MVLRNTDTPADRQMGIFDHTQTDRTGRQTNTHTNRVIHRDINRQMLMKENVD